MFKLVELQGLVRIPPTSFGKPIKEAALEQLRRENEGETRPEAGIIITITKVLGIQAGRLVPGDGAAYHKAKYIALTYQPILQEVVEGEVVEIVDFGAFIRVGPIDGLCHVSQITDDFISYDSKRGVLLSKDKHRTLKEGDIVRGRVVAVSMSGRGRGGKLGLTMRQPHLGSIDWIEADLKDEKKKSKGKEKQKTKKTKSKKPEAPINIVTPSGAQPSADDLASQLQKKE
ncbi:MAG: DNA-directed RNA polymerase [Candidatus Ranarchaeia archaeon]|jgi:DNA-directed RNA polymerase subunit E'